MAKDSPQPREESQLSKESILPLSDERFSDWSKRMDVMLQEWRAKKEKDR
jgi:hypothetical protein